MAMAYRQAGQASPAGMFRGMGSGMGGGGGGMPSKGGGGGGFPGMGMFSRLAGMLGGQNSRNGARSVILVLVFRRRSVARVPRMRARQFEPRWIAREYVIRLPGPAGRRA
jgi:hypothetical protein